MVEVERSAVRESPRVAGVIALLSVFVCAAVAGVLASASPGSTPALAGPSALASLNAGLNAGSAVLLLSGYFFIRQKRAAAHRACMVGAFALSSLFLVTYLVHHAQVGSVPFRGQGAVRTLYYAVLIPHVVLAAGIVPLALTTLYRAVTGRWGAHRAIARWTLPLWLYVSISGVAIYWMLYHLA